MISFERRIRAFSIDMSMAVVLFGLISGLVSLLDAVEDNWKLIIAASTAYFGTLLIPLFFSRGQSFGNRTQKMRVIDIKTGEPAPLLLELLRELLKGFLMLVTFGFYLIVSGIMFSSRRDGRVIHDFVFRTQVVCITRYVNDRQEPLINQTEAMKKRMEGSSND